MFEFDGTSDRRKAPEPDLVPILDGLTAVIFFMLLSISFIGMTKLTIPPSAVAAVSTSSEIPLSARLIAQLDGESILLKLEWIGRQPGELTKKVIRLPDSTKNLALIESVEKMAAQFKKKYPNEKTVQIALASRLNYQELISVMDGLRKNEMYEDLVLSSYTEAE
jgi:biopolymer transport protein ExbD